MDEPDFTIAVAIYNVGNYLKECIESIIGQLDGGMELLLVDDGSTDGCGDICDGYAQMDSRITAIHQKNGGLSAARNTAIEHASGEWLFFVDGDDKLPENSLAAMREYCQNAAQLIIFDYAVFDEHGVRRCCLPHGSFIMDTPEALRQYRASTLSLQPALADKFTDAQSMTSWGKLWRLSFIKEHGLRFDTAIRRGEDNAFAFSSSRYMNRILVVNQCVYEYRQNGSGIVRRFEPKTPEQYRILISTIRKDMISYGETDDPLLVKGLYDLYMGGFYASLHQSLIHANCHWKRKERIAWLKNLAGNDWIKAASEYRYDARSLNLMLLHWLRKGSYWKVDLYCRTLRQISPLLALLRRRDPAAS